MIATTKRTIQVLGFALGLIALAPAGPVCFSQGQKHVLLTQPDSGRANILELINGAKTSINLTIYEIEDPAIVSALGDAAKRGVTVRVLYNFYSFERFGHDPNAPFIAQLQAAGVQTKPAGKQFFITHQKTLTIDDKAAVIMTFNLAPNYFTGTRDFGVITQDQAEVSEISDVFTADWSDDSVSPSQAALVWSPVNSRSKFLGLINGARKSLSIYNQEAADEECMTALIAAAKRGVTVRFISAVLMGEAPSPAAKLALEPDSQDQSVDKNAAEREVLNENGVDARGLAKPYIHAKMMLADYGTDQAAALISSENFSKTSLDRNRELGILVDDTDILSSLNSTFESDWQTTQPEQKRRLNIKLDPAQIKLSLPSAFAVDGFK
jgi:phosphatidylserine/phosphatidylglycerophosphate/cardiolipin synthase-like enzyme